MVLRRSMIQERMAQVNVPCRGRRLRNAETKTYIVNECPVHKSFYPAATPLPFVKSGVVIADVRCERRSGKVGKPGMRRWTIANTLLERHAFRMGGKVTGDDPLRSFSDQGSAPAR